MARRHTTSARAAPKPRNPCAHAATFVTLALLLIAPLRSTAAEAPSEHPTPTLTLRGWHDAAPPPDDAAGWGRPRAATRTPAAWNFDTRVTDEGVIITFPIGWVSGNPGPPGPLRAGFPSHNHPGFSNDTARSGTSSFKLPTKGGSTSVMLATGLLHSMPGADYTAVAHVTTKDLRHARVRLTARYAHAAPDHTGNYPTIPGTERSSPAIQSPLGWTELAVNLPAIDEPATIQLEIQLLQPAQLAAREPLPHEVMRQDVRGAAYIDDVAIHQVPALSIATASSINIIEAPDTPDLIARVNDLTGEDLRARIWVWDMRGNLVDTTAFDITRNVRDRTWTPTLPGFGWYRVTLGVRNARHVVGVDSIDLCWVAEQPPPPTAPAARFGITAESDNPATLRALPAAVRALGVHAVAVAAWNNADGPNADDFHRAMDAVLSEGAELAFVLERAPAHVAQAATRDPARILEILSDDPDLWLDSITPLLSRYGERVTRWRLGPTGSTTVFDTPELAAGLADVAAIVRDLVPGAGLVLPWDAQHTNQPLTNPDLPSDLGVSVNLPAGLPASSINHYVRNWPGKGPNNRPDNRPSSGRTNDNAAFVIQPIDHDLYGGPAAAEDLAKRATLAWSAGARRIATPLPFDADANAARPRVTAPVWRTIAAALGDHRPAGELPMPEGARAFLGSSTHAAATPFGDEHADEIASTGVIVAWSDYATGDAAELRAHLGDGNISAHDIYGNPVPVTRKRGVHVVPLTATPAIINGVNAELLRFSAGLRFDPDFIENRAEKHTVNLVVTNPWPRRISGTIRVADPEHWEFNPRVIPFALQPGESTRVPVELTLGVGEESGERGVIAHAVVETGLQTFGPIEVPIRTTLGLEGVGLNVTYRIIKGPTGRFDRVVVSVLATNEGDTPLTLEAFARARGYRTELAPISNLVPGESHAATFVFDDAAAKLFGGRIRVGLREQGGNGRLNKTIEVRGVNTR